MAILTDGQGNTRLIQEKGIKTHCDYLRTRYESMELGKFTSLLEFFGVSYDTEVGKPWSPGGGALYYENRLIGTHGFVGGFTLNDDGSVDCMIDLPGEYWESQDAIDTWRLFGGIKHAYQGMCSRVDLAIDDPTYSLVPVDQMVEAWEQGNNFQFRKYTYIVSGNSPEEMKATYNFGSRESGRYTRIYDHDGECLRHETEFKRQYAQVIFDEIYELKREDFGGYDNLRETKEAAYGVEDTPFAIGIQQKMASLVVGAIDFRSREAYKDSSRVGHRDSERLCFYQEYIDKIQASHVRVRASQRARSLGRTVDWFRRQCGATLALIASSFENIREFRAWAGDFVIAQESRMNKLQRLWIDELRRRPNLLVV